MTPEQMDQLLENLVQKLADEGHIIGRQPAESKQPGAAAARAGKRRRASK